MKRPAFFAFAVFAITLGGAFGPLSAQSDTPVAGKDYIEISGGAPFEPEDGKIVVEEFFNYACPACADFEPLFSAWKAKLPDDVKVTYIPAAFRQDFEQYARAYYAAEVFGLTQKTHTAVYNGIHRARALPSEGQKPNEEKIAAFYASYGVSADDFLNTMRGFAVNFKIRRATQYMRQCKVTGTPSLVVNGRYLVKGTTRADTLRIAEYLIAKERAG